ncbi:MAG TPA: hypothetical protein VJM13_07345 [Sphingopyxis sp.]|nr:hypothetical protein [Sphingopyxis sp.]
MRLASTAFAFLLAASAGIAFAHAADPQPAPGDIYRKDDLGRIVEVAGRKAIACPRQTDRTDLRFGG